MCNQKNVHADNVTLNLTTVQYKTYPAISAPSFCIGVGKRDGLVVVSSVLGKLLEGGVSKVSLVIAWATKSGNKWGKK